KEAMRWPRPRGGYLQRRWWQDSDGQPYSKWENVPNRPLASSRAASPFVIQRQGEAKERPAAVRALILYPMNALVEDQLARIRRAHGTATRARRLGRSFPRSTAAN